MPAWSGQGWQVWEGEEWVTFTPCNGKSGHDHLREQGAGEDFSVSEVAVVVLAGVVPAAAGTTEHAQLPARLTWRLCACRRDARGPRKRRHPGCLKGAELCMCSPTTSRSADTEQKPDLLKVFELSLCQSIG